MRYPQYGGLAWPDALLPCIRRNYKGASMREYRLNQKTALISIELLRDEGVAPSDSHFVDRFYQTEQHVLKRPGEVLDQDFSEALNKLGEDRVDELLYQLAVAIDEQKFAQRIESLKAALAASQIPEKDRGFLRRLFGF